MSISDYHEYSRAPFQSIGNAIQLEALAVSNKRPFLQASTEQVTLAADACKPPFRSGNGSAVRQ